MTAPLESRFAALEASRAAGAAPQPATAKVKRPTPLQFVESLSIEDKDSGRLVPFVLWPAQSKALTMMIKEPRLFFLKARQLGATWLVLAVMLYWGTFDGNRLFLIARQSGEDAADAIHRLKTLLASMPDEWRPEIVVDNVMTLELSNGSRYRALTATTRIGRGAAAFAGLADELCFWEWQAEQLASLEAGCSRLFIVTTGNGPGDHAHKVWQTARLGKGSWKCLFLPWHVHPARSKAWYRQTVEEAAEPRLARREYAATPEEAFASPAGIFFERFTMERNTQEIGIVANWPTVRCVDFGYRHPACAWVQTAPSGQPFVVAELVPANMTTDEFAGAILAKEAAFGLTDRPRVTYCDPAGNAANVQTAASEVTLFARMGLAPASKASSIRDGCVRLMDMLADPVLPLVVSTRCEWLCQAFSAVKPDRHHPDVYDEGSDYTHILDSLRYWAINVQVGPVVDYELPEPSYGAASGLWGPGGSRIW